MVTKITAVYDDFSNRERRVGNRAANTWLGLGFSWK